MFGPTFGQPSVIFLTRALMGKTLQYGYLAKISYICIIRFSVCLFLVGQLVSSFFYHTLMSNILPLPPFLYTHTNFCDRSICIQIRSSHIKCQRATAHQILFTPYSGAVLSNPHTCKEPSTGKTLRTSFALVMC